MITKILVTGAGALLGQGVIRSLRQSNLRAEIIAVDPARLSVGLYWADRGYTVPLATDPSYVDRLRYILSIEKPDIIMVGTDVEKKLFAERRAEFQKEFGARTLVSTPDVIEIADDKYATYKFLRDAGFYPPASVLPGEEHSLIAQVGFPIVVKPRVGGRSRGVSLVRSRDELDLALACGNNLVLQECVGTPDMEFTAGAVHFPEQEVVTIVMRRDLRDGNTYRAYVDMSAELNQQVVALARALKPYGPVNFQFRVDSEGRVRVFEINARFSGTTPLRALAGFHEVEMCVRYLVNCEPLRQPQVRPITILRYWSEMVVDEGDIGRIQ